MGPGQLWQRSRWEMALVGATAVLFFTSLDCPLQEPEEPRYAEIPRQMLAEGRWLVPVLHGQPYYDKPPLLYWLVMVSYRLLGVHDWSARLVAAIAAALCVLVTYGWGRWTVSRRAGLAGAFVLCLSARFTYLSHLLTMNGLLCLCTTLALATAHRALARPPLAWGWWLTSAMACALGILAKGVVAVVLVLGPVTGYALWSGIRPGLKAWATYLGVVILCAGPWFAAIAWSDPGFLEYFFWKHHVERFLAPFDHAKPAWFYLPELLLGMLPWTLLLPALARHCWRSRGELRTVPGPLGFFLLAAVLGLAFFSTAGSKRSGYVLPALPPLALALGYYLDATMACGTTRRPSRLRGRRAAWTLAGAVTFLALAVLNQAVMPGYARRFALRDQVQPESGADAGLSVVCYPHRWDSVSFYLDRNDVRTFHPDEQGALIAALFEHPRTLVFVKNEGALAEFLDALPASLEFLPHRTGQTVTAGWVQRKER